jgi:ferredoxin-NADP reductase
MDVNGARQRMHAFTKPDGHGRSLSKDSAGASAEALFMLSVQTTLARLRFNRLLVNLGLSLDSHRHNWSDVLALRLNLVVFRVLHLVLTLVVWQHFFYIKFRQQEASVPDAAPNRGLKRFVPPFEFGAMHAILLQLAVIPLTMCRSTLAWLATSSPLRNVLPFEHLIEFHIFVGYVFCTIMVLSVIVFFAFFGKVCSDHLNGLDPANLCKNFHAEIMFTGYFIFISTLVILGSSFFRARLAYEVFYRLHIVFVFSMFFLAIMHTMDDEFRAQTPKGRMRSHGWIWFSTSLVIYFADKLWSRANMRQGCVLKAELSFDLRTVVLFVRKPAGFVFQAGQHASLQVPAIDASWHPFSIGSAPLDDELVFFIQVMKAGSWTARLSDTNFLRSLAMREASVNVMGPYGYPIGGAKEHDRILAIGTGTGIVPMFSLMWERAHRLGLLTKEVLLETRQESGLAHAALERAAELERGLAPLEALEVFRSEATAGRHSRLARTRTRSRKPPTLARPPPAQSIQSTNAALDMMRKGTLQSAARKGSVQEADRRVSVVQRGNGRLSVVEVRDEEDVDVARLVRLIELVVSRSQLRWRARLLQKLGTRSTVHRNIVRTARREAWHGMVNNLAVCVAILEVAFVPANVSWSNLPERAPAIDVMAQLLKWSTVCGIAFFVLHRLYMFFNTSRFQRTTSLVIIDPVMCLLQGVMLTLYLKDDVFRLDEHFHNVSSPLWLAATPAVNLSEAHQVLLCFFGFWRIWRTLDATSSTSQHSHGQHVDESESTQLLGQEKFTLVWVTRSADLLLGYLPELDSMLEVLRRSLYLSDQNASLGELLQLKIYCTDPNQDLVAELKEQIKKHHLQENVFFERPDVKQLVLDVMCKEIRLAQHRAAYHRALVTFCGAPTVASVCLHGCAEANVLAARLGQAPRMDFREEFYGHSAGSSRKQSGATATSKKTATSRPPAAVELRTQDTEAATSTNLFGNLDLDPMAV